MADFQARQELRDRAKQNMIDVRKAMGLDEEEGAAEAASDSDDGEWRL